MRIAGQLFVLLFLAAWGCKDSSTDANTQNTSGNSGGLTANPANVTLLPSNSSNVSIIGATRPVLIVTAPASSIATATLSDTVLSVHAGTSVGSTSVRVGDNSMPQKTVTIDITIATTALAIIIH